ncbi:thioredoxin-disulfide reductase [Candidatus Altiarchaeota archaeon]
MDYDFIIIGGGPAGLTAGIYAARRNLKTLVIEKALVGGQMQLTPEVGNWPGEKIISGQDLSKKMEEHAKSSGVEFLRGEVDKLELKGKEKKAHIEQKVLTCGAVLIAAGGEHRKLGIPGEDKLRGGGVSYCATCDAPFFKEKTVAVVGGGNTAVEDAIYLSEICSRVYIVHRRDSFRAEENRVDAMKQKGVVPLMNSVVEEINGESFVESITLKDTNSGDIRDIELEGVFVSIGNKPDTKLAEEAGLKLDEKGYVKVKANMQTNIPGVFAAGDVVGGILQITTAVGEGCTAALSAYDYIKNPYWSR